MFIVIIFWKCVKDKQSSFLACFRTISKIRTPQTFFSKLPLKQGVKVDVIPSNVKVLVFCYMLFIKIYLLTFQRKREATGGWGGGNILLYWSFKIDILKNFDLRVPRNELLKKS